MSSMLGGTGVSKLGASKPAVGGGNPVSPTLPNPVMSSTLGVPSGGSGVSRPVATAGRPDTSLPQPVQRASLTGVLTPQCGQFMPPTLLVTRTSPDTSAPSRQ